MVSRRRAISVIMAVLLVWVPLKGQKLNQGEVLSPNKARNYSLFLTLVPMACGLAMVSADPKGESGMGSLGSLLLWMGGTFGPGAGYLYAHHPWGFWRGAIIRTVGLAGVAGAAVATWDNPDASGGWEIFIAGSALYLGTGIFDILNSAKSAKNYNEDHGISLKMKPCYIASRKAPGLMISVSF